MFLKLTRPVWAPEGLEGGAEAAPPPEDNVVAPDTGTDPMADVREAASRLSNWRKQKNAQGAPNEAHATEQDLAEANAAPDAGQPSGETEDYEPQEPGPIEAPTSWSAEEKERFASLPPETQAYIANRERERDAEIRRRQNEYAERMKAIEPEAQALARARAEYENALPQILQMMQSSTEFADIRSMADVEALARDDWPRYVQWDAHQRKMQMVQQELEQVQNQQAQQWQTQWDSYAQEQDRLFSEKVPEMSDPKRREQLQKLAVNTLQNDYGFTPEEMQVAWNGAFRDHRVQQLLLDAARYRQLKKNPPKQATRPAPTVQKPGAAPSKPLNITTAVKAAEEKLNQTGSLRDAAALSKLRRQARAS